MRKACVLSCLALALAGKLFGQTLGDVGDVNRAKIPSPFQIEGLKVKTRLSFADPGDRPVFQEIVPCRLIDTRPSRAVGGTTVLEFVAPDGGPVFQAGDTRSYTASGALADSNPCSLKSRIAAGDPDAKEIPHGLVALALRVVAINRSDASPRPAVVTVGDPDPKQGGGFSYWVGFFGPGIEVAQDGIVKTPQDNFTISTSSDSADTDILVDVLGYFLPDTLADMAAGVSTLGTGAPGPAGPAGPAGAKGDVGPTGPAGPAGAKGDVGPAGPVGPAGAKGDNGPSGPAGPAGAKGDVGPAGATGPAGAKGDVGPAGPVGPAGAKGDIGPAGATGPAGPSGPAGAKGDVGPAGPAGAIGPAGPAGPAGGKGDTGPAGPAGAAGPAGPSGPIGPPGPQGPAGQNATLCTGIGTLDPLGETLIQDACITSDAIISLTYANEFSTISTALAYYELTTGSFEVQGQPFRSFRWIVFGIPPATAGAKSSLKR